MTSKLSLDFFSSLGKRSQSATNLDINRRGFVASNLARATSSSFTGASGFAESLTSLHAELDNLEDETTNDTSSTGSLFRSSSWENNNKASKYVKISRAHWKDASKAHSCAKCLTVFGFASKKHNCRRCGDVFCEECCQYKRKLSPECIPDAQGNIYRVCYVCADRHSQPLGEVRNLTSLFHEQRQNKRMTISNEIERLVHGFQYNVDPTSRLKIAMTDTFSLMKVPEWQKSNKWLESSDVDWCTKCTSKFTFYKVKHHCRLCGSVYCDLCCQPNLILYYDDKDKQTAKATLIGVVGCPEKEPAICLYLSICRLCQDDLEEYQVQQYHLLAAETRNESKQTLKDVGITLEKLKNVEKKLDVILPRYQELVEIYVFEGHTNESLTGQKNVEFFAKLQSDLSDVFTQYAVVIQGLKQYELTTKTELKIMKNIIMNKCKQYNASMYLFKSLKDNLDKSLPAKALENFQRYANTQAINNTYVMTRQLGLEALHLASKHGFEPSLAEKLSEVDQVCYSELKNYLLSVGDDWDEHISILNALLKIQLKEKKLITPNVLRTKQDGKDYVYHLLVQRSCSIVYQTLRALKAKSSDLQFTKSKQNLQTLLNEVSELNMNQGKYYRSNSSVSSSSSSSLG